MVAEPTLPFAVIDIGSSSIRMEIAQKRPSKPMEIVESLQQEVTLGADVFSAGFIHEKTIGLCVEAFRAFQTVLQEYSVSEQNLRVFATSAVREARNRDQFCDRIFMATSYSIQVLEESEASSFLYQAIRPLFLRNGPLKHENAIVVEVGAGSTEILVIGKGKLLYSHTYRLGSFRLRETLEHIPPDRIFGAMELQIQRTVRLVGHNIASLASPILLALGSDVSFAASQLNKGWDKQQVTSVTTDKLKKFTEKIFKLATEQMVKQFGLSFPSAETVAPSLLTVSQLAKNYKLKSVHISPHSMRQGVLWSMVSGRTWSPEFRNLILNSAIELGRRYKFDELHALHVAHTCSILCKELSTLHQLSDRDELLLNVAALLHEIGLFISHRAHHKHSMYVISQSEIFGLSSSDLKIVALVARYHRKSVPSTRHALFGSLDRTDRIRVFQMAALLRIATALDRSYQQRLKDFTVASTENTVIIGVKETIDTSLESHALVLKGNLFQTVFGKKIILHKTL